MFNHNCAQAIKKSTKNFVRILISALFSVFFTSLLLLFYYTLPLHYENTRGDTDYVWQPNSFWIRMTEGISVGSFDSLGFNNTSVIDNPDILVLGSSHIEAAQVMQNENTAFLLNKAFSGKYSVYNKGISGHNFTKICQYLSRNLEIYNVPPKIVILETSTTNITNKNINDILTKKVKHTQSHTSGIIGLMQRVPFFRLLYMQIDHGILNIFIPKKTKQVTTHKSNTAHQSVDIEPYNQLFDYLSTLEKEYGTQIIIVYHPTGKLQKDGSIKFESSEKKNIFQKTAKENCITFVDLTDDFKKMYYEEHHVAHGFITGKLEYGHLNKYGHATMAKALYRTILDMEKGW